MRHQHARRNRHVQRLDCTGARHGNKHIGKGPHAIANADILRTDNKYCTRRPAAQLQIRPRRVLRGNNNRDTKRSQAAQRREALANRIGAHVLRSALGHTNSRGRKRAWSRPPMSKNGELTPAEERHAAHNGANVVRIAHTVEAHTTKAIAGRACTLQQLFQAQPRPRSHEHTNALVMGRGRQAGDILGAALAIGDARSGRLLQYATQRSAGLRCVHDGDNIFAPGIKGGASRAQTVHVLQLVRCQTREVRSHVRATHRGSSSSS